MDSYNRDIRSGFVLFIIIFLISIPSSLVKGQERLDLNLPNTKLEKMAKDIGYSIIQVRKGISLEKQMRSPKTIYIISSVFNLDGRNLQIPDSSYIKFTEKGAIKNGAIKGQLLNESVDPIHFGAMCDGKVDDTQALQNVINLNAKTITLKGRKYYIDRFLTIPSNTSIEGNNATIIFSAKEKAYPGIRIQSASDVSIAEINFYAENKKKSGSPFARTPGTLWSNRYAITASSVSNITIENCSFAKVEVAIKIDGGIGDNNNVTIRNCMTEKAVNTPIYISHTKNAIIDGCKLHASTDASKYDHHIYGCTSNQHHVIANCHFYAGLGIPVHYYTTEAEGEEDILVENCFFENTCGAIIVSSQGEGTLTAKNLTMNSTRDYDNGIFRSGGNQTLIVEGATINAPYQRLVSCQGKNMEIKRIDATIGGLAYSLPTVKGNLNGEDCELTLLSAPYLLYLSEKNADKTGNVTLKGNSFTINNALEYLISVRGTTAGKITFDNNEILCTQKAKYAIYNAGKSSKRLIVKNNYMKGVAELHHKSIKGSVMKNNNLER